MEEDGRKGRIEEQNEGGKEKWKEKWKEREVTITVILVSRRTSCSLKGSRLTSNIRYCSGCLATRFRKRQTSSSVDKGWQ